MDLRKTEEYTLDEEEIKQAVVNYINGKIGLKAKIEQVELDGIVSVTEEVEAVTATVKIVEDSELSYK